MGYIQAVKAAVLLAIFGLYTFGIWHTAVKVERSEWLKKELAARQVIEDQVKEGMEKTIDNVQLAQKIEVERNEKQQTIDKLNTDLRAALNSMPKRSICRSSNVSQSRSPSVSTNGSIIDTEISDEFKEFLISDAKRADGVGLYAEQAYEWAIELCKNTETFICK